MFTDDCLKGSNFTHCFDVENVFQIDHRKRKLLLMVCLILHTLEMTDWAHKS